MDAKWEEVFKSWAQPPGVTEQSKSDNAETAIRKAINVSDLPKLHNIRVFPQGSYRNRTSVRMDSDVDISVLCTDTFFYDLAPGVVRDKTDLTGKPATYQYATYKNDIEKALVAYFGRENVKRGNKAFDIHANTYRVDADVVACFEYRYYFSDGTHRKGIAFDTDAKICIHNYPDQTYTNGVQKNDTTGRRYKAMVRILKRLRNYLQEQNIAAAKDVASFLIESLVWNVPNAGFGHYQYTDDVRHVLAETFNATLTDEKCDEWVEVNNCKYLFRATQPWTRHQAHSFLDAAWDYIGFK